MIRKRYIDDIEAIARGEDPKAIVRDPAINRRIDLPIINKDVFINGLPASQYANKSTVSSRAATSSKSGQPDDVRHAWKTPWASNVKNPAAASSNCYRLPVEPNVA